MISSTGRRAIWQTMQGKGEDMRRESGLSRRGFLAAAVAAGAVGSVRSSAAAQGAAPVVPGREGLKVRVTPYFAGGWTMYMFADRCNDVMLSTLFRSPSGKVVMIDGGWPKDVPFLLPALKELGGTVDTWFLTHAHFDHYGALGDIIKKPKFGGLRIKKVVHDFLPLDFIAETEKGCIANVRPFLENLRKSRIPVVKPKKGQKWDFGEGLSFECLNEYDLSMRENSINCSSICYRVMNGDKSVMVTGDIGWQMADKMLKTLPPEKIKSDVVFLSHHGQSGAKKNFYKAVHPEICVWPTPQWLWDNNNGPGYGSGPWFTNYTKCWLQELGIKRQILLTKDAALGPRA